MEKNIADVISNKIKAYKRLKKHAQKNENGWKIKTSNRLQTHWKDMHLKHYENSKVVSHLRACTGWSDSRPLMHENNLNIDFEKWLAYEKERQFFTDVSRGDTNDIIRLIFSGADLDSLQEISRNTIDGIDGMTDDIGLASYFNFECHNDEHHKLIAACESHQKLTGTVRKLTATSPCCDCLTIRINIKANIAADQTLQDVASDVISDAISDKISASIITLDSVLSDVAADQLGQASNKATLSFSNHTSKDGEKGLPEFQTDYNNVLFDNVYSNVSRFPKTKIFVTQHEDIEESTEASTDNLEIGGDTERGTLSNVAAQDQQDHDIANKSINPSYQSTIDLSKQPSRETSDNPTNLLHQHITTGAVSEPQDHYTSDIFGKLPYKDATDNITEQETSDIFRGWQHQEAMGATGQHEYYDTTNNITKQHQNVLADTSGEYPITSSAISEHQYQVTPSPDHITERYQDTTANINEQVHGTTGTPDARYPNTTSTINGKKFYGTVDNLNEQKIEDTTSKYTNNSGTNSKLEFSDISDNRTSNTISKLKYHNTSNTISGQQYLDTAGNVSKQYQDPTANISEQLQDTTGTISGRNFYETVDNLSQQKFQDTTGQYTDTSSIIISKSKMPDISGNSTSNIISKLKYDNTSGISNELQYQKINGNTTDQYQDIAGNLGVQPQNASAIISRLPNQGTSNAIRGQLSQDPTANFSERDPDATGSISGPNYYETIDNLSKQQIQNTTAHHTDTPDAISGLKYQDTPDTISGEQNQDTTENISGPNQDTTGNISEQNQDTTDNYISEPNQDTTGNISEQYQDTTVTASEPQHKDSLSKSTNKSNRQDITGNIRSLIDTSGNQSEQSRLNTSGEITDTIISSNLNNPPSSTNTSVQPATSSRADNSRSPSLLSGTDPATHNQTTVPTSETSFPTDSSLHLDTSSFPSTDAPGMDTNMETDSLNSNTLKSM